MTGALTMTDKQINKLLKKLLNGDFDGKPQEATLVGVFHAITLLSSKSNFINAKKGLDLQIPLL